MKLNALLLIGFLALGSTTALCGDDPLTSLKMRRVDFDKVENPAVEKMPADKAALHRLGENVALANPRVQTAIAEAQEEANNSDEPVRKTRKFSIDARLGLEGLGVGLNYTPEMTKQFLTVTGLTATTGAWWSLGAEGTVNILAKKNLTPIVSVGVSYLVLTPVADQLADSVNQPINGQKVELGLSGHSFFMGKAEGGIDYLSKKTGLHCFSKLGIAVELGDSMGGGAYNNPDLSGLWGPAFDVGCGGSFK